jgi:hypothetical protein
VLVEPRIELLVFFLDSDELEVARKDFRLAFDLLDEERRVNRRLRS